MSPCKARQAKHELRLVDATLIRPGFQASWTRFQRAALAAKVHVVFDPAAGVPIFFEVTPGNTNDITVAKADMPVEPGATPGSRCRGPEGRLYVFDLGYYDFGFWAALDQKGCRFVTRLKRNTPVTVLRQTTPPVGGDVVADQIVRLPGRLANRRGNPFDKQGRRLAVKLATGRTITLFTNDLTSPADEIADLYKTRWQIELFFRWLKQHLRIRHFLGRSENAVRLQIAAAILVYLLLKLVHAAAGTKKAAHVFLAILRASLFHRLQLAELVERIDRPPRQPVAIAADLQGNLAL